MKVKTLILASSAAFLISFVAHVAHAQSFTDNQIAEILEEANDAEIDAAKMAKSDAYNKEVKEFAKHMIDEHKQNNDDTKKVVSKYDLDPESSDLSKAIKEEGKMRRDLLKQQKNSAFDKLYMEQQVSMHQKLLDDLDKKYIPSAQKPEFKTHLQATRVHVNAHLEKAKALQAKL